MTAYIERENFSERLRLALCKADYSAESPTLLAQEFNIRFPGKPITAHAVRKWLHGEAIPTQEKVRTLAQWLGVPVDWLRFGTDEEICAASSPAAGERFDKYDVALISELQRLDEPHRIIARELIRLMVRLGAGNRRER